MVEKVELNIAMMTAGIEKRADEFTRNVDDELSDLRCEIVSERASNRHDITEAQPGVNTNLNTTSPQTCRANCDAQETDVYTQGRGPTHQGRVCPRAKAGEELKAKFTESVAATSRRSGTSTRGAESSTTRSSRCEG